MQPVWLLTVSHQSCNMENGSISGVLRSTSCAYKHLPGKVHTTASWTAVTMVLLPGHLREVLHGTKKKIMS